MRPSFLLVVAAFALAALPVRTSQTLESPYAPYNEGKMAPQRTGCPLTEADRTYVFQSLPTCSRWICCEVRSCRA
jgi:hypothetical protein